MKGIKAHVALQTAIVLIVFSAASRADDKSRPAFSQQELEAKIRYCKDCHGESGQGFRGHYPIPRLAGQTVPYLESKFQHIVEHKQNSPTAETFMVPVLGSVEATMRRSIATHFSGLDPAPAGGGPKDLIATGKKIYEEGVPEANVPACVTCHGPEAKGSEMTPRLAGQLFPFTIKVLKNWTSERGQNPVEDKSVIKLQDAHSLAQSQIEAVASYLGELK